MSYILCLDQGTTSTRAMVLNSQGHICASSQDEFQQHFPQNGWIEHRPEDLWHDAVKVCRDALLKAKIKGKDLVGMGITNQRETTILWQRSTGEPIYNAIVWQDRRTHGYCQQLKAQGYEELIEQKTGLRLDPYFSASKIRWLLDHAPGARELAQKDDLLFGTVETYLLWKFTQGQAHKTDITNASRTALFNIHTQTWDQELLDLFDIPKTILPQVEENCADFGTTAPEFLGTSVPIYGMIGDQQAASLGQACFQPGMMKSTYGTGAFMLLNTGAQAIRSSNRLLTTTAYKIHGQTSYAIEGSVFVAGAAIKWLRDNINFLQHASDSQALAESVPDSGGVYMVPAFTGLGAPYWQPDARGAILGLTRDTHIAHITRATLEAIAYSTRDLLEAMQADGAHCQELRVDGGMVSNDWVCQNIADILQTNVLRPRVIETTVMGVAFLVGLQAKLWQQSDCENIWHAQQTFEPLMPQSKADALYFGWQQAVQRLLP